MLWPRDMVYYEGVRTAAATGVVTNVSGSTPQWDAAVPLPRGRVRSTLMLHFKRFEACDGGRSTRYTTLQHLAIGRAVRVCGCVPGRRRLGGCSLRPGAAGGWLPNALAHGGVLDGLRKEFVGYKAIIASARQPQKEQQKEQPR